MTKMIENVIVLERGLWTADDVKIHKIADRSDIQLYLPDHKAIEKNWKEIKAKNPKAFGGPVIRLMGRHHLEKKLILEVASSDYRESCLVGWLGVAMVPVTRDGYIVLQGPVAAIAATIGGGIRAPGCTPVNAEVIPHIVKEVKEEFNVNITKENLTIIGLLESRPPISKLNHCIVTKVTISLTYEELKECWEGAEDKWEGPLIPLKLDYENRRVSFKGIDDINVDDINPQSQVIIAMIAENEFKAPGLLTEGGFVPDRVFLDSQLSVSF